MNTLFFIASKLVWALIRPETWIILGLGWGYASIARGRVRRARRVLAVTLIGTVSIAILPLGESLVRYLETSYPTNPALGRVDGIIVLGGAEDARRTALWDQVQMRDAAERFTATLSLARRFPEARVVFTGGSGALRDALTDGISGSTVAERFFTEHGLQASRLIVDKAARNTAENARLSMALAQPEPGQTWVLVTSAYHMPRALRSFERAGWTGLIPYPVDFRSGRFVDGIGWDLAENLRTLNVAVKEYVGLVVYAIADR